MKKHFLIFLYVSLAGCGLSAQTAKVVTPNGNQGYAIRCNGFSGWEKCYQAAGEYCGKGYTVISKDGNEGLDLKNTPRSMMIECK